MSERIDFGNNAFTGDEGANGSAEGEGQGGNGAGLNSSSQKQLSEGM